MILTVVMDERTYLIYEKRIEWRERLRYLGGWNPTNAVSGACLFQENVIVNLCHWGSNKTRSFAWQAGKPVTILWRNQINHWNKVYFKYTILYSIINLPSDIATSLRNSRYLYCTQVRSILVRRDWFGNCTKCFVVLLVIQKWCSRW